MSPAAVCAKSAGLAARPIAEKAAPHGQRAAHEPRASVSATTGGGSVTRSRDVLCASNYGTGAVPVPDNGDVTGTSFFGIFAQNYGTALSVISAAGTTVSGGNNGIVARNYGTGALTITANG